MCPFPIDAGWMRYFPFMLKMNECASKTKGQFYIQRSSDLRGPKMNYNLLISQRKNLKPRADHSNLACLILIEGRMPKWIPGRTPSFLTSVACDNSLSIFDVWPLFSSNALWTGLSELHSLTWQHSILFISCAHTTFFNYKRLWHLWVPYPNLKLFYKSCLQPCQTTQGLMHSSSEASTTLHRKRMQDRASTGNQT